MLDDEWAVSKNTIPIWLIGLLKAWTHYLDYHPQDMLSDGYVLPNIHDLHYMLSDGYVLPDIHDLHDMLSDGYVLPDIHDLGDRAS